MRLLLVTISVAILAARGLRAQEPVTASKKTSATKTSTSKAAASKTTAHKSSAKVITTAKPTPKPVVQASASKTTHRRVPATSKSGTVAHRATAPPPRQQTPTAERYKEIQQAMVDKGYFNGPVDGTWGPGSVDALKRFQRDQNLTDDGKIGSLSLIALGLGPKRAALIETTPEKPVQQ